MANYLIYYIAFGEEHKEMAKLSIESLYIKGYTGDSLVITDTAWTPKYAPSNKVAFEITPDPAAIFLAKKIKAKAIRTFIKKDYDAVLYLDCDCLAIKNPTPILDKIAASPDKIFVPVVPGRGLIGSNSLRRFWTKKEKLAISTTQMIDSFAVGFVPNDKNKKRLKDWENSNEFLGAINVNSDAQGLNHALVKNGGRLSGCGILTECVSFYKPGGDETIRHFQFRTKQLMESHYWGDVLSPYLDDLNNKKDELFGQKELAKQLAKQKEKDK